MNIITLGFGGALLVTLGLASGRPAVVPEPLRMLVIGAEDRALIVGVESLLLAVSAEDRALAIGPETRALSETAG